jgi:hypothetical protein
VRTVADGDSDARRMCVSQCFRGWRVLQGNRLPGWHLRRDAATTQGHRCPTATARGGARYLSLPVPHGGHLVLQFAYCWAMLFSNGGYRLSAGVQFCRRGFVSAMLPSIGLQVHQKISERLVRLWRGASRMARGRSGVLSARSRRQLYAAVNSDTESAQDR